MTAPRQLLRACLGARSKSPHHPSISDSNSDQSVAIATEFLKRLRLLRRKDGSVRVADAEGQKAGAALERETRRALQRDLARLAPMRTFEVAQPGRGLREFAQYRHLAAVDEALSTDSALRVVFGTDYEIKIDVSVGEQVQHEELPLLHAIVSCKLTFRSDRAQNVRLEAAFANRHRRGRQPHVVALTAEPLPTRLLSLARGTGDLDALYHVSLDALAHAVDAVGNDEQRAAMDEMVSQRRLLDYDDMVATLAT